jgi:hypothetical protein
MQIANFIPQGGHFLMLGFDESLYEALRDRDWTGIIASNPGSHGMLDKRDLDGKVTFIEGWINHTPDFQRRLDGLWVKPTTVDDIMHQWGDKRFDMIVICVPMMVRELWQTDKVQAHLPKDYLLKDDGWNQPTIAKARDRGYNQLNADNGWLLLRHS